MENKDRLKILRILGGYTQPQLSATAQIPPASLGAIEKGLYNAVGDKGTAIAKTLGVPFDYLYQGTPLVDSEHPQVWIPAPPARGQHLQAMLKDISSLFPDFIEENSFSLVVVFELNDGGLALLLGREQINDREKAIYSCLILSDTKLATGIKAALVSSNVNGYRNSSDIISIKDKDINSICINDICERVLPKDRSFECNIDGLTRELVKVKNRRVEKGSEPEVQLPPAITYIYRNSIEALCPTIKPKIATEYSDYFVKRCKELGHLPNSSIADTLVAEFSNELNRLGSKQFVEKPSKEWLSPDNDDYSTAIEWLKEELSDSKSPEERAQFLQQIACATNYELWKAKFNQEVKDGKRIIPFDF